MNKKSISSVPLIEVIEVIDALREDLKTAQANSDPDHPLIVEEIEIELQAVVTKEGKADAKAKIEVLNVGKLLGLGGIDGELNLNGSLARASTQKIKLRLSAGEKDKITGKLKKAQVNDEADFE